GQAPVVESEPRRHQPQPHHRAADPSDQNAVVQPEYFVAQQDEPRNDIRNCRLEGQRGGEPDDGRERQTPGDGERTKRDEQYRGGQEKAGQRDREPRSSHGRGGSTSTPQPTRGG